VVFLEERRYARFAVCAIIAVACKEEIGIIVAALSLWHLWRGGNRTVALVTAGLSLAWSFTAVLVLVPHFASGASAYWQRYIDAGVTGSKTSSGVRGLLTYWFHHPEEPFLSVLWPPKLEMVHRYLVSTGYLGIMGLPLLIVSLPSLGIILLSTDQHMYGGLGQYSAELVPIGLAASVYGVAWLAHHLSRRGFNRAVVTTGLAVWLILAALANQHLNGFSPIATSYAAPVISAHDRLGQRLLKLIPPGASVSSMDQLNPHLGDRSKSYLFPDVGDADYVALDVETNVNPGTPAEQYQAVMRLLQSRHWNILAADDGYLILRRVATPLPDVPTIPAAFYTFALSQKSGQITPIARFGPNLELVGVQTERREQVNLRVPDVVLVTSWRVTGPLPASAELEEIVTNTDGRIVNQFYDRPTTDWLPLATWEPGEIVQVRSQQLTIVDLESGQASIRVAVRSTAESGHFFTFTPRLLVAFKGSAYQIVDSTLQVASIHVSF
jgi:hypothetical protein